MGYTVAKNVYSAKKNLVVESMRDYALCMIVRNYSTLCGIIWVFLFFFLSEILV